MAVIRGGYWRSSEANNFPPESIQTGYFTHLFYATVAIDEIDARTYQIRLSNIDQTWIGTFTPKILQKKADVKCILSIGEDTVAGRTTLSNMISTPDGRKSFIIDSISKAREHGYHGLDLYWKYPATANEFDMPNLWLLFKEWNNSLKEEHNRTGNPKLSLSTIVYFAPKFFPADDKKAYPFKSIMDNVDFVNLVCYDYYGSQDVEVTAEHALLYDQHDKKSTHYGISSWIDDAGVPEGKLVMGLPLYGRRWELVDQNEHGIGAPATGVGPMDYSDILKFNRGHHADVHVVNDKTVSTYLYAGQDWIGYDSKSSIKGKVQYAKDHALGGYFFWALGMDKEYKLPQQGSFTYTYINNALLIDIN
ncbi:class V chitinase CHIT5-like [Castanea sativa]|uniref:class V chitinase CHIT5-like n=1 Tax=Castanea sativa TaxID=21020 RepID=UPI003F64F631